MNETLLALPEIVLLTMTCVVLIVDLYLPKDKRGYTYVLAQLGLLLTLIACFSQSSVEEARLGFYGAYVLDPLSINLKAWIIGIVMAILLYSREYLKHRNMSRGEYYVLGMTGTLGMLIMVSANSLLSVYLGLELLSLSLYAMVAFNRDNSKASEAAMKYFVLGALASGMLLYGMSMLYGATGSLGLDTISAAVSADSQGNLAARFGLVFIIVGIAFKLGAVPFHMWLPDIYDGAPTSVTLFIASAPKIAAFAMTIRLLNDALQSLHADWHLMLIILAVLSIVVGNLIAIAQSNIKRMLAYSTISHVGFLLLGIISGTEQGYASAMFYTITYAFTSLAAFGVLLVLNDVGFEAENIADLKGLFRRNPGLALVMMVVLLSMAGVPPTVGFYAKLIVLKEIVSVGHLWLALIAVFMSVLGAFYYLRVIKFMFFDEPDDATELTPAIDTQLVLGMNGVIILVFGLFPGIIMSACTAAFMAQAAA
ncbi:MAG: NADH-quinone oxidoreductase subunit NuoN [Gammaproteobacteria bacterium]|nr:NADH-quinone oxidoreductase subunit NuoN [Gammaproteobacteria bacterium]